MFSWTILKPGVFLLVEWMSFHTNTRGRSSIKNKFDKGFEIIFIANKY